MIPSPFHGIFSTSFGEKAPVATGKDEVGALQETAADVPPMRKAATGIGQVTLDVFEYENYYIVRAPIAGVRLSDLDIDVNDNVITIRGTRREMDPVPDDQYFVRECFFGDFERKITLPCSIDPKRVKATLNKECILKILIPKEDKVKIVRIND